MYGSSDSYSYNDIIDFIIKDIGSKQVQLVRNKDFEKAEALDLAIDICEEHKKKRYG